MEIPLKKLIIAVAGMSFLAGVVSAQTPAPMTKDSMKQEDKNSPMGKDRQAMPKAQTKGMQKGTDMPKGEMQGEPKKK
jgi:hypothetical protein